MPDRPAASGVRRREFLKILGATSATTVAVGCGSDRVERLIPYLNNPDETVPGVSNYYASTCRECAGGCGVLLETRDGRTFKLEGNPDHPLNRGALCARGQAAVQGLYNPDRYRQPMVRRDGHLVPITWAEALKLLGGRLAAVASSGQAGSAVFINKHESGSFPAFLDGWLAGFGMPPHLSHDPVLPMAVMTANRQSYGVAWPSLDFGAARLIVSFGADFLDGWGASVPQQLDFANARAKLEHAPRFVYIGARRSLTGLSADEWIPSRPGGEIAIANALRGTGSVAEAASASGAPAATIQRLQAEAAASRPSLFLAGGNHAGVTALALAVNELNRSAGNVGVTIKPAEPITNFEHAGTDAELVDRIERMRSGQVPMLMVRGVNPAFSLPRSARAAEAIARVPFKVSFSSYPDETSELCDLVLPDHHPIEAWGDAQPMPNRISLQQPGMDPVYDTRQTADVLLDLARGVPRLAATYGKVPNYRTWLIDHYPGGMAAFTAAITDGIGRGTLPVPTPRTSAGSGAPPAGAAGAAGAATTAGGPTAPAIDQTPGDYYFLIYPSLAFADGSGANKPWLQELPDPVSKISWQSWIEVSPATAKRLAIDPGDVLRLETPAGAITAPAYIYPGLRADTVAMAFGQGHTAYGRYAKNVGVNPMDIIQTGFEAHSGSLAWTATKVRLSKTGDFQQLVTTEGSARQHGRGIARSVAVGDLGRPPAPPDLGPGEEPHDFLPGLRAPIAADAQGEIASGQYEIEKGMYDPKHWSHMAERRWAMTIDLARCTGCSACITACYAENNIPVVGAPYQESNTFGYTNQPGGNIIKGREMTWIRLERYWEGDEASPTFDVGFVPMLCQHCGDAPCEPVCPVYATYTSPDGLNVQVYNRCVGTRYCSNNCPYKVRYFNWFGYGEPHRPQYAWPERMSWQLNPDVTVRGKGVMEKCTFCVQRIREAEHRAQLEGRSLEPDEFTVSCAQACPSRAIVFGDAAHPEWSVAKLAYDRRGYHVFEELNTFTAVVYLKKVTHPAPAAPVGA